jgi:hypothetical protein
MKDIVLSKKFWGITLGIAVVYIFLAVYLMNFSLVKDTVFGSFPLSYKFNLLVALLGGMWTAMTRISLMLLIVTATLTGINITLLALRLLVLRGGESYVLWSAAAVGLLAADAWPVVAFFHCGRSGSIIYLPFQGTEISVVAVLLLCMTLYFMVVSYPTEQVCEIINKSHKS